MSLQKFELPTGFLFTDDYSKGKLETLSIGDYGKKHNVKADFLGLTRPITGVENQECMPLSEKWVITLSTQFGCPMKCTFCDVPKVEFGGNASFQDLKKQFYSAIRLFPNVKYTERLNIHFARMGEPAFNNEVLEFSRWLSAAKGIIQKEVGLRIETLHPVFTTSMPMLSNTPGSEKLVTKLREWCNLKNSAFNGQAGLQLSINSTNEEQRRKMFGGMSLTLKEISEIAKLLPFPIGRKYCLNFAFATGYEIDAKLLKSLFDPEMFMVKITPIHSNNACRENSIQTVEGYSSFQPYEQAEKDLIAEGFDVLIFVPSMDEEDGLVTCGNAILGGSKLKVEGGLNIAGQYK